MKKIISKEMESKRNAGTSDLDYIITKLKKINKELKYQTIKQKKKINKLKHKLFQIIQSEKQKKEKKN